MQIMWLKSAIYKMDYTQTMLMDAHGRNVVDAAIAAARTQSQTPKELRHECSSAGTEKKNYSNESDKTEHLTQ